MRFVPLIAASLLALALAGCKPSSDSSQPTPPQGSTPSMGTPIASHEPLARYQVVFGPHARADTFLVDTQKGRIWQLVKFKDIEGEPAAFDEIAVVDESGEIGMSAANFRRQYESEKTPKTQAKKAPREPTFEDFTKDAESNASSKRRGGK